MKRPQSEAGKRAAGSSVATGMAAGGGSTDGAEPKTIALSLIHI